MVKVLAVGELPDRRPYLAMERLEGETLASVLARGPLALTQALELFSEPCLAVGTLHEQGLIHRDLKPENVYIVNDKHAVLLDFGIAKEVFGPRIDHDDGRRRSRHARRTGPHPRARRSGSPARSRR